MKRIKLNVPQGLGDIFWIYQKTAPYFDEIQMGICAFDEDCVVQKRSLNWLNIFPKIKEGYINRVHSDVCSNIMVNQYDFNKILKSYDQNANSTHYYSCNYYLDKGIRIEAIDPHLSIQSKIDLLTEQFEIGVQDYILLYISGNTKTHPEKYVWKINDWVKFLKLFYNKFQINYPLILIGASFDRFILEQLAEEVKNDIKVNNILIDLNPEKVCHVIKSCKFFVGYQSGLNIIADNFDVKQLMMYFPVLKNLQNSWPQKKNILNKTYNSFLFDDSPENVLESLPLKLFNVPTDSKFYY